MKKLLWTTLGLFALSGFALAGDCKKCDKDDDKAKEDTVADCKKCKKDGDEDKEEGALAGKCKKECDKDGEAEEGTLA